MKRSAFIVLFIGAQLVFVVAQIHKHTLIAKLSYLKQKLDAEKYKLAEQKQALINQWYKLTNRSAVKEYAEKELHLQPLSLSQVKKIAHDKQNVQI